MAHVPASRRVCFGVGCRVAHARPLSNTPKVYPLLVFPIAIFAHKHEGFLRNPKNLIPGTNKQVSPMDRGLVG